MSDLVSRLLAAIEQTERLAQDATTRPGGHQWGIAPVSPYKWGDDERDTEVIARGKPIVRCDYERGGYLIASHIVHHDPESVARRCAADREIVETCAFWLHENDAGIDPCARSVLNHLARGYGLSVEEETTHE